MICCVRFREGRYGTKFIPQEYPTGFSGVNLTHSETLQLVCASAALHAARLEVIARSVEGGSGPNSGADFGRAVDIPDELELVVVLSKNNGDHKAHEVHYKVVTELKDEALLAHVTQVSPGPHLGQVSRLIDCWAAKSVRSLFTQRHRRRR